MEFELIPYRKGNKWGFCTPNKKIVIDCIYDHTFPFSHGLAVIHEQNKRAYIDSTGTQSLPSIFQDVSSSKARTQIQHTRYCRRSLCHSNHHGGVTTSGQCGTQKEYPQRWHLNS